MNNITPLKLLFVINAGSGHNSTDWHTVIQDHFKSSEHEIELFDLPDPCSPEKIQEKITGYNPSRVVAVGGDGTVKLVAECLQGTGIPLGILPAGSANGMAKELGIPEKAAQALDIIVQGGTEKIHCISINDHLCIHLSDIGFNAFVVKKFETGNRRGMAGYIQAAWKVLWNKPVMQLEIKTDSTVLKREASMIVVANATMYGTGALINPDGKLNDNVFEVVVIKKLSLREIFKMVVTHMPYNPAKTEVLQTSALQIRSARKVHFQVDGEYLGKVHDVKATLVEGALDMIVPEKEIASIV